MIEVFSIVAPVFVVVAFGYFIRRGRQLDTKTLSTLNIYLFIPSLIFTSLSERAINWNLLGRITSASVLMLVGMWFILSLIARWRGIDVKDRGAFLMTMFPNLGNFGIPVCMFAFGDEGLVMALLVVVIGSLFQNVFGIYLAQRTHHGVFKAFRHVFQFPLVYAFLLALLFARTGYQMPLFLSRAIEIMADAAIPIQLMILGVQLGETALETGANVFLASGVRLIVGPLMAALFAITVGLNGVPAKVFVLQMSGPVAVAMAAYGVQFDVAPRFLSSMVAWTFLFSLITVTAVLYVLRCVTFG